MPPKRATKTPAQLRAPLKCCYSVTKNCSKGEQREGNPRYNITEFQNESIYVAEPFGNHVHTNRGIILWTDAAGIWQNSCLLADQFAAAGYVTVVPNMAGRVRKVSPDGHPGKATDAIVTPRTEAIRSKILLDTHKFLLENRGCAKIGVIGYGAGCVSALLSLGLATPHTASCGFIADPGTCNVELFHDICGPLSIAVADEDHVSMNALNNFALAATKQRSVPYQVGLFSHVQEGFFARRAVTSQSEVYAKKAAFVQAIMWMDEHLLVAE